MLLFVSPLARIDSGMNLSRNRRPIFHFSLERFLNGQIRGMNWQGRRGMMIGRLQLVPAKPITMRLGKVQIMLIKIEVGLFVIGKCASDALKGVEFSLIQFEAFAPDCPHIIRVVPLFSGWFRSARLKYLLILIFRSLFMITTRNSSHVLSAGCTCVHQTYRVARRGGLPPFASHPIHAGRP